MNAASGRRVTAAGSTLGKGAFFIPVIKMCLDAYAFPAAPQHRDFFLQQVPDICIVAAVYINACPALPHGRKQALYNGSKEVSLGARAADGKQEAHGASLFCTLYAEGAVPPDVTHQLMVNVVTGIHNVCGGHGRKHLLPVKAVEGAVAPVGTAGLHGMQRPFGQMEGHRPVVGDGIHHMRHARMNGRLRGPDMGGNERRILGDCGKQRRHQFGAFLVTGIVAEFPEAFAVERFPDKAVEQAAFLRQAGCRGIHGILVRDDFCCRCFRKGIEVEPERRAAHGLCRRCHCHGNPVVPESHAYVADNDRLFRQTGSKVCICRPGNNRAAGKCRGKHFVVNKPQPVLRTAVVPKLPDEFLLRTARLAFIRCPNLVPEYRHTILLSCNRLLHTDSITISTTSIISHFCFFAREKCRDSVKMCGREKSPGPHL